MTLPEGLQQHALYTMDGRTWIERYLPPQTEGQQRMEKIKLDRGWMRIIPQDQVQTFVEQLKESG